MGRRDKFRLEDVYAAVQQCTKKITVPPMKAQCYTQGPTLRELADYLGGCSTRTIYRYVMKLREKGAVATWRGARGLLALSNRRLKSKSQPKSEGERGDAAEGAIAGLCVIWLLIVAVVIFVAERTAQP